MVHTLRKVRLSLIQTHRIAEPASTLMLVSVLAVALGLVTRLAFAKPSPQQPAPVVDTLTTQPGSMSISFTAAAGKHVSAYLPGLSEERVKLTYDDAKKTYQGLLSIPSHAPAKGYFTLRLIDERAVESDHLIHLSQSDDDQTKS
ncbi:MAG: hypothetical protein ACON3Z_12145 [Bradymonadia bacterium]